VGRTSLVCGDVWQTSRAGFDSPAIHPSWPTTRYVSDRLSTFAAWRLGNVVNGRRALFEIGVRYSCAECGCDGTWQGKPLTLDVNHINGEWRDNRRKNLRLLCPNCHSQTDTWRSMNFRRRRSAPPSDLVGDLG